jgi:hypothetical protein
MAPKPVARLVRDSGHFAQRAYPLRGLRGLETGLLLPWIDQFHAQHRSVLAIRLQPGHEELRQALLRLFALELDHRQRDDLGVGIPWPRRYDIRQDPLIRRHVDDEVLHPAGSLAEGLDLRDHPSQPHELRVHELQRVIDPEHAAVRLVTLTLLARSGSARLRKRVARHADAPNVLGSALTGSVRRGPRWFRHADAADVFSAILYPQTLSAASLPSAPRVARNWGSRILDPLPRPLTHAVAAA